jgi:predicted patatin/cPLA2 family phospholipase
MSSVLGSINPIVQGTASSDAPVKRSLVLAGGGMRVAYQAGVVRALHEAGLDFFHADGTSGGTMNLAMLLSGLSAAEMCQRWRTLHVKDFVTFMPFQKYLDATQLPAMGDARGVIDHVFPHLGIDVAKINAARHLVGTFNVCNYTHKTNEAIPNDRVDLDLLVAGISLPIFMPAVAKNGCLYMDSVWIKDANCMEAVKRGADEIWLVWCIGNHGRYLNGAFNQYVHMIELSANGKLFEEFEQINQINRLIAAGLTGEAVYGHTRPIVLHVIKPEYPLPLDPDLYFNRIDTTTLIDIGFRDAWRYLRQRNPDGIPLTPEATRMKDPQIGISFREQMSGPFALGETDPQAGADKGKAANTVFTMRATVNIQDLDRFIADPNHLGSITGEVDFPLIGQALSSRTGVFNLFSPSGDPRTKYMVYELGFTHGHKDYYMAGKKLVKDDPLLEVWSETTTLLTVLHEGNDASGPVIGAGILHLSLLGLLKMVPTMTVTNAETIGQKAAALEKFGRFFAGQIYDSYIKHSPA